MRMIEVFNGRSYLFTVLPSDDPTEVLRQEMKRYPRLKIVTVESGERSKPQDPWCLPDEEENEEYF